MKDIGANLEWENIKLDILQFENDIEYCLLTEDMFQIKRNGYIVDSGWYSGQDTFITFLIFEFNWSNPIVKIKSKNIFECKYAIQMAINYAEKIEMGGNVSDLALLE